MKSKNEVIKTIWRILFYVLIAGFYLGLNSCCTEKDCAGFDDLYEIQLLDFDSSDVDSIAIEFFESNSNFTTRVDSSFTSADGRYAGDTQLIIFIPGRINTSSDYKITLYSTGQTYQLTGFTSRKEECNCPSDKYNVLDSYFVNGERQISTYLTITN